MGKVPRPFKFSWGEGQITEEATFEGEWTINAIQLLSYDGGGHSVRFCYFNKKGQFQRSPLMLGDDELDGLREAMEDTPQLRELVRRLVEEPPAKKRTAKKKT